MDDIKFRDSLEIGLIDPHDEEDLAYWIQVLAVPRDRLCEAVEAVGMSSHKVQEYLAAHGEATDEPLPCPEPETFEGFDRHSHH